jgi:hypothetical protein
MQEVVGSIPSGSTIQVCGGQSSSSFARISKLTTVIARKSFHGVIIGLSILWSDAVSSVVNLVYIAWIMPT